MLARLPNTGDPDEVAWAAVLQLPLAGLRDERPRDRDALVATTASYGYAIEALEAVLDQLEVGGTRRAGA